MIWDTKPGDLVVCIDDEQTYGLLKAGLVYTCSEVVEQIGYFKGKLGLHVGFVVEEVSSTERDSNGLVQMFNIRRFRPVKRSAIDVFRNLLVTLPQQSVEA